LLADADQEEARNLIANKPPECLENKLKALGDFRPPFGENGLFSVQEPMEIMIRFVLDDGNPDRKHRENIFSESFKSVGISYNVD